MALNLLGQVFTRLTVIAATDYRQPAGDTGQWWICKCECGKRVRVRQHCLRKGTTRSCGCLARDIAKARRGPRKEFTRRGKPEYTAWQSMIRRCHGRNVCERDWKNYGGRGITVCDEWRDSYESFLSHIGPRPAGKYSLDRIDNDKGYLPGNVRWATWKEQADNRRQPKS